MPTAKTIRKAGKPTAKKTSKTAAAKSAAKTTKKVTLDDVWATIDQIGKAHRETEMAIKETQTAHRETEKAIKETQAAHRETEMAIKETQDAIKAAQQETEKAIKETQTAIKAAQQETEKAIKETQTAMKRMSENVGGLNLSMGELIETLFAPHLGEKFDAYHYNLKRVFHRVPIYDDTNRMRSDIDILLSNTTVCMAVEVKRWLDSTKAVDEHINRMALIRQYPPAEVKGKTLLGAIVGAVVTPEALEYAEQNGFFVLELTGDDARLIDPPKDFKPKEW